MAQNFETFLKSNLSWIDYEELNKQLDISPKACTQLINAPERGNKLQLEKIVQLLQKWTSTYTATVLVKQFKFGKNKK